MVRNVPHLAMIPLVVLWFGIGEESKIFLVAIGVLFPVYINTLHGIRSVDNGLIEMGNVYGALRFTLLESRSAWRTAFHSSRTTLRFRHHVVDPNRIRNDRYEFGHRLSGHERKRIHANRYHSAYHFALCLIWKAGRFHREALREAVLTMEPELSKVSSERMCRP